MTFDPTTWVNEQPPDITAEQLNRIEQGIVDAHELAADAAADASQAAAVATAGSSGGALHYARVDNPHQTSSIQVGARHSKNAAHRGALGDDAFDNTTVLQSLLDEIRTAGKGELYLPGDANKVYRTKGLYVPSNCRIVSDGAAIRITGSSPTFRHQAGPDPVYSSGLYCNRQSVLGETAAPENILIEGLRLIDCPIDFAGVLGGRVQDCQFEEVASLYYAIAVGERSSNRSYSEEIYLLRNRILAGRRNGIELTAARHVWVLDNRITDVDAATVSETAPACGIELEANVVSDPLSHVTIRGNNIRGCAGSGIGVVMSDQADAALTEADHIVIDGNHLTANAMLPFGAGPGTHAGTTGGIYVKEGQADNKGSIRIVNNTIRDSFRGSAVNYHPTVGTRNGVVLVGNDLRFNPDGAVSGPVPSTRVYRGNLGLADAG